MTEIPLNNVGIILAGTLNEMAAKPTAQEDLPDEDVDDETEPQDTDSSSTQRETDPEGTSEQDNDLEEKSDNEQNEGQKGMVINNRMDMSIVNEDSSKADTKVRRNKKMDITQMKRIIRQKQEAAIVEEKRAKEEKMRIKQAKSVLAGSNRCGCWHQDAKRQHEGIQVYLEALQVPLDTAVSRYRAMLCNALCGSLLQVYHCFPPPRQVPGHLLEIHPDRVQAELLQISTEVGAQEIILCEALMDLPNCNRNRNPKLDCLSCLTLALTLILTLLSF